jgi:hypothetical protein
MRQEAYHMMALPQWWPIFHLWLSGINSNTDYQTCKAHNHWHSGDAHFQDAVWNMSVSRCLINAGNWLSIINQVRSYEIVWHCHLRSRTGSGLNYIKCACPGVQFSETAHIGTIQWKSANPCPLGRLSAGSAACPSVKSSNSLVCCNLIIVSHQNRMFSS